MAPPPKVLEGVRVVTMAQNVPGPLAAARMLKSGALVVKIEPPGGDPLLALSPAWHAEMHDGIPIERLDLKQDAGKQRVVTLLRDADVFVTSHRPSALERLSLDPDSLAATAPQLRTIRVFGSVRDPEHAGHDLTYQAQRGLIGNAMPRTLTADVMASERVFAAVLSALRIGGGSVIDVGLVESLEPMTASLRHGLTAPHGVLGGGAPRYGVYSAKVGRIAVAALGQHFEHRLYEELGLSPGAELAGRFMERTAAEWEAWGRDRDVPLVEIHDP